MTNTLKETKAQKVERLKRAMNPWEGLEEIRRFAREGFESIPPEWIGTYFRWWGVYTQGDGAGVTGGQGGEGRALQRFMVRIRIPNGMMSSRQLRAIADLTRQHANGIADLTVRQNIQLHWVTIESLPEVLEEFGVASFLGEDRAEDGHVAPPDHVGPQVLQDRPGVGSRVPRRAG